jgi:hypothetical protein
MVLLGPCLARRDPFRGSGGGGGSGGGWGQRHGGDGARLLGGDLHEGPWGGGLRGVLQRVPHQALHGRHVT